MVEAVFLVVFPKKSKELILKECKEKGIQQSREQKHRRMLENFKMVDGRKTLTCDDKCRIIGGRSISEA